MQFLDLAGVKKFKQYTDDTFITAEDVSEIDSVVRDTYTKQEMDAALNTKQNLIVISSLEPTPSDGKDGDIWIVI